MTKEIALHCMKSASELERELCEECPIYGQTGCDHCYEDALQYVIAMLEQEPFKPMVEIDLYSVIKQKYIERKVLDKISAEIERQEKWLMDAGYNQYNVDIAFSSVKSVVDKYKAETENT